jgi:transposase
MLKITMKNILSNVILNALRTKDELTLKELYEIIGEHSEFTWELSVRKHRVRSVLDYLKRQNKIERSSPSTYKLV